MNTAHATSNTPVFYIKRTIGLLLLLAMAATFFYSAYTKSGIEFRHWHIVTNDNAFDSFQWTFLDMGISSVLTAGVVARMFIGLELMLGLFLLFHIFLKGFTYPAVIAILSVFIIYLLILLARQGNTGNCGCFGDKLAMKPLTAIWKNVIMIAATILLMYIYPVKPFKFQEYLCMGLALAAFSAPFLVNFVFVSTEPEPYTTAIDFDLLYKYSPAPDVELRKGRHIVAFMSLTCPHCKKAAYLLHVIHNEHPDIPMYLVLDGPAEYEKRFYDETHAADVPHIYYKGHSPDFVKMAGTGVPSIIWENNGQPEYKSVWAYYQLDPAFMEKWMNGKVPPPPVQPAPPTKQ